jgi:hypothetical protein
MNCVRPGKALTVQRAAGVKEAKSDCNERFQLSYKLPMTEMAHFNKETSEMDTTRLFIDWYEELQRGLEIHGYNDFTYGQLIMISNVLKKLLSPKRHAQLTRIKQTDNIELL